MPTIIPNSRTILSIYPLELEHYARHNGFFTYKHPVAPRDSVLVREYNPERMSTSNPGSVPADAPMYTDKETPCGANEGYSLIRVFDTFTWSRDFSQDSERFVPRPLSALDVARQLVTSWASDVVEGTGAMGPGVIVIAGETPTTEEKALVLQRQTDYARALIETGTTLSAQGEPKKISDLHRTLARWMGAENLPWLAKIEQVKMKICRACGERIRAAALVCKECSTNLPKFYAENGLIPDALEDPAVFAFMDKATAAKVTPKFPTKAA